MTDVKRRHPFVQADITQSEKIEILDRGVPGKIGHALAPGVISVPGKALRETLPELNLEAVIVAPAGVINVVQAASHERVEQEKVDRIRPRRVGRRDDSPAGAESIAEHATNVIRTGGHSRGYGAGRAVVQAGDKIGGRVSDAGSERQRITSRAEGCVEDGQCNLALKPPISKIVLCLKISANPRRRLSSSTRRRVCSANRQVILRILELVMESVFEDVDVVQIHCAPAEVGLSADVGDLQHGVLPQLTLDAESIIVGVWGA